MLIGAVLLWRALVVGAFADSADVPDPRFLAEWSSPGLNRSVKLTFTSYNWVRLDAITASLELK